MRAARQIYSSPLALPRLSRFSTKSATSPTPHQSAALPKQDARVTKLPNGITVASVENYSPVTRLAVVFKAGARHENGSNLGVTHALRRASALSNKKSTAFGLTRNINQIGGSFVCSSTREHMIYTMESSREDVETIAEFLSHASCNIGVKPWELANIVPKLKLDLAFLEDQPETRLVELIHDAAFRDTLGRSLYTQPFMIGEHSVEMIMDFVNNFYTTGRMALVGTGIEHEQLLQLAKNFTPSPGTGAPEQPAKYYGGNNRLNTLSPLAYATLVTEGSSLKSKDFLALSVVQHLMGSGPRVKYGSGTANKLGQAAAQVTNNPFAVSCFTCSYSDSGLFGWTLAAPAEDIGKIMTGVLSQFRQLTKGDVNEKDILRAKHQLKASVALGSEDALAYLDDLALQALNFGEVHSVEAICQAIDAVSAADILSVAKKVVNGKPSMAAVGNLSDTPYLDQLF